MSSGVYVRRSGISDGFRYSFLISGLVRSHSPSVLSAHLSLSLFSFVKYAWLKVEACARRRVSISRRIFFQYPAVKTVSRDNGVKSDFPISPFVPPWGDASMLK